MGIRAAESVLEIQTKTAPGLRADERNLLRQSAAAQEQASIIAQNVVRLIFQQSAGLAERSQLASRLLRMTSHPAMDDDG